MKITGVYGIQNTVTREFESGTTVGDLKKNADLRAALGFSDNVQVYVNGVVAGDEFVIGPGNIVAFEDQAGRKA